jgi:acyl-CoA thioester hydrolase
VTAAEPDPQRALIASYPRVDRVTLRYADVDPSGPVSATAIARLFEDGRYRIRTAIDHPHARDPQLGFVLARIAVDLLASVHYPGSVHIAIGVGRIGRTSFDYLAALFQDDRCVALSDATVAVRDRRSGTSYVLPPTFHAMLAPLRYDGAAAVT